MKISIKLLLLLFLSLIPIPSHGDIYEQSGHEEGNDGIILLTEKCQGSAGEEGFRVAVIRPNGGAMQGCHIKNNRGRHVAKWQDGIIIEIPSNIFTIKETAIRKTRSININSAIDCIQPSKENEYRGTCPYLFEVLKGDSDFKNLLLGTFSKYKVQNISGPDIPLRTILIDEKMYITGWRCEAHNCNAHLYTFIYSPSDRRISGIYQPDGQSPYFFGAPNEAEKSKLLQISQ